MSKKKLAFESLDYDPEKSIARQGKAIVFKFSLDIDKDGDLINYLKGIRGKSNRGQWITNAVRTYRDIEIGFKTTDAENIRKLIRELIEQYRKSPIRS